MKLQPHQLPDVTDFNFVDCKFGGDDCVWIYPHLEGVKWTPQNLIFRSSIWRKSDWQLVSPGLKKFFNWEQHPEIHPPPTELSQKINVMEKLDGSCLVVSRYNDELIIRTRRALARTMLNGEEIDYFLEMYPGAFSHPFLNNTTFIFEWLTPSNRIVLKYDQPELRLLNMIYHEDYSYAPQDVVDVAAETFGIKRPKRYSYNSLAEMRADVAGLQGEEGRVVYYHNDQWCRKDKSEWYVAVHNVRNGLSLKNVIELYFAANCPDYQGFMDLALEQYKVEGMMEAMPFISTVHDGMKEVTRIEEGMKRFVDGLKKPGAFKNRKEQAEHIFASYGQTERAHMLFTILDGKPLTPKERKKLLFQCLAK